MKCVVDIIRHLAFISLGFFFHLSQMFMIDLFVYTIRACVALLNSICVQENPTIIVRMRMVIMDLT